MADRLLLLKNHKVRYTAGRHELTARMIIPTIQEYDRAHKLNPNLLPAMAEAIRAVRENGWFSEELYARFTVLSDDGTWNGISPLSRLPEAA